MRENRLLLASALKRGAICDAVSAGSRKVEEFEETLAMMPPVVRIKAVLSLFFKEAVSDLRLTRRMVAKLEV